MAYEIKSDKELLIEVRNKVAGRIIENKANTEYWNFVVTHAKHDSQEIIDARKSVELNEDNVKERLNSDFLDRLQERGNR